MSFLLDDHVRVTETPFNQLFPEIGRLAGEGNIQDLLAVRYKIHSEFLKDTENDEVTTDRLKGIQWRFKQEYELLKSDEDRLSFIQARLWDGAELDRNPDLPGLGSY